MSRIREQHEHVAMTERPYSRGATLAAALIAAAISVACVGEATNEQPLVMVTKDDYINATGLTFLKGRCCARLSIESKEALAVDALVSFGRAVADGIPADGSTPASDEQLTQIIPASGDVSSWQEETGGTPGPWLVSTTAYDWINGSGGPFEDNGFEAVAGDRYVHDTESWHLDLEVVNLASMADAATAFTDSGWDQGTPVE